MSNRRIRFADNVTLRSKTLKKNIKKQLVGKSNGAASSSPGTIDLFDPLGVYAKQEAEIAVLEKVMTENGTPAYPELRDLFNYFKPTAADLTRTYTKAELKEFCLRVKCKVRMELFNPVEDYARRLRGEGRLQNRSERYVNKILTKAIMRNKDTALYSQEEIDMHRQFQWRERRRQNNLNLVVWKTENQFAQNKKRKHQLSQVVINSQNTEISDDISLIDDTIQYVHEAYGIADDNNNVSEEQQPIYQEADVDGSRHIQTNHSSANNNNAHNLENSENVENMNNSDEYDKIEFLDMIESENVDGNEHSSQSQTNGKESKSQPPEKRPASTQELADMLTYSPRTQEVDCEITISSQASQGLLQDIVQLNTESMTIEEEYNVEWEEQTHTNVESEEQTHANENAMQQSEPLLYDYFNSQIPLTSTQSQHGSTQPES